MKASVLLADGDQVDVMCDKFVQSHTGQYVFLKTVENGKGSWGYPDMDGIPVAFFEAKSVVGVIDDAYAVDQTEANLQ